MEKVNVIEELLKEKILNFNVKELNLLFYHCFNMVVYEEFGNMYLSLKDDDDKYLDPDKTIYYYFKLAKIVYKDQIEKQATNNLKREFNKLLTID